MLVLVVGSKLITRKLSMDLKTFPLAELLEIVVTGIMKQIEEVGLSHPEKYIGFLGTLFLFVALAASVLSFRLRTADCLPLDHCGTRPVCVYSRAAVRYRGAGGGRLPQVVCEPTFIMLPFNIISELSRTLALAVRLFGNMMSGAMIIGILLTITPFLFPIVMMALGLLTGMVQAYIFSILAAVYHRGATRTRKPKPELAPTPN